MVGLVLVSHSARLAEGVAELAREMGGEVAIEVAAGLDEPGRPLGTDAFAVARAIEAAASGDGVLVLMDLGSAVLSAEMALELEAAADEEVRLCSAPLVEGAVAAAAAARQGAALEEVAREAGAALAAKQSQLGDAPPAATQQAEAAEGDAPTAEVRLTVDNPLGLHARPAARLVQTLAAFDATVTVANATLGRGPVPARSLTSVATLGLRRGHEMAVRASGPEAEAALAALEGLAADSFGDAASPPARTPPDDERPADAGGPGILQGVGASPGIALGPARARLAVTPDVPDVPAGTPDEEWAALQRALEVVRGRLRDARAAAGALGEDDAQILDAQLLMLDDGALLEPVRAAVRERGESAAAAYARAAGEARAAFAALEDSYQRARAADIAEVARRVLVELVGGTSAPAAAEGVLVVDELEPAEVVTFDAERVDALVAARGGATSHGAILARAAGIPAVVGVGESVRSIREGTRIAVDGTAGRVWVDPGADTVRELERRRADWERERGRAEAAARGPAVTADGRRIGVFANAGSVADARLALRVGAEGIGLLRTEVLFVGRPEMPDEEEQFETYLAVARALDGRPVVLRTLDAGADKPLVFLEQAPERNPFLGRRGIRLALAHESVLRIQLRAALRVAAEHPLRVMLPMVSGVGEVRRARALIDEECTRLGVPGPPVGVMVEVPGAALAAARLAAEVEFFSIGTNDLAQYTMAAERDNASVAPLADALHPSVLRLVEMTCTAARMHRIPVAVCGELASDVSATAVLVGLGVAELSVAPPAVATVKATIRALELEAARGLARRALSCEDADEVRALTASEGNG